MMTAALAVVLSTEASMAGGRRAESAPSGEASRALTDVPFQKRAAKATPGIKADRSATRAAPLDDAAATKAFTLIGRSRDGKTTRTEPGPDVIKAIQGETPKEEKRSDLGTGADPVVEEEDGTQRAVVGADNRTAVRNTATYPYSAVGYLEMTNVKGEIYSCTATVVGRFAVLTAAHCLYNHEEEGGWRDKFTFWPGINGENTVPFGGYEYDMAYLFDGYVSNYEGAYDTVWPYDIAMLTFKDPVGDATGSMGYWNFPDFGDFEGNLVAYHDDKKAFTQWRSVCEVIQEDLYETDFTHNCDFASGASGAPIYFYDREAKQRTVMGVNIGESGNANWALRIYEPVFAWMESINQ